MEATADERTRDGAENELDPLDQRNEETEKGAQRISEDLEEADEDDDDDAADVDEEVKVVDGSGPVADEATCNSEEDLAEYLINACSNGDLHDIQRALAQGAQVDSDYGNRAFIAACYHGDVANVAFLLKEGASPVAFDEYTDTSALQAACGNGHIDVVQTLIDGGALGQSVDHGALVAACRAGYYEVAELLLLEGGAEVDCLDNEAICEASRYGHESVVELLLNLGADPIAQDGLPLILAAGRGHPDVVDLLLCAGADVHLRDDFALRNICREPYRNQHAVLNRLLEAGANVHANDDEALQAACATGPVSLVKRLLEAGANVHARNGLVLMQVCIHGRVSVVETLIDAGASVGYHGVVALDATVREIIEARDYITPEAAYSSIRFDNLRRRLIEAAVLLVRSGVDVVDSGWDSLEPPDRLPLLFALGPSRFRALRPVHKMEWLRYVLRPRRRLLNALFRVRARLDRPPSQPLGTSTPSRDELIAHLKTAGRRFAREYWAEGLPIFLKGAELGPVPDEFHHVPKRG